MVSMIHMQMIFTTFYSSFLHLQKWGKQRGFDTETAKKGLYLELSRKDHSSTYSKGEYKLQVITHSTSPFTVMPLRRAFPRDDYFNSLSNACLFKLKKKRSQTLFSHQAYCRRLATGLKWSFQITITNRSSFIRSLTWGSVSHSGSRSIQTVSWLVSRFVGRTFGRSVQDRSQHETNRGTCLRHFFLFCWFSF